MDAIIVSITDFRRNAGAYINRAVPITIVRDSQVVGSFIPNKEPATNLEDDINKIKRFSGKFRLNSSSPKELNDSLGERYDKMLPR